MKEFKCAANIGIGLFTDEAVPIKISFPDGSYAELKLHTLTPSKLIAYRKEGIKVGRVDDYKNEEEALAHSKKLMAKLVESGTYFPVEGEPIDLWAEENRERLNDHILLMSTIIQAARRLAEDNIEEDLKN
jgi:hypothetical protein